MDNGSFSPRRPLPSLPPLSSTHKLKSSQPILIGPSTLGDLSDIDNTYDETVQVKKKRKRRRRTPRSSGRPDDTSEVVDENPSTRQVDEESANNNNNNESTNEMRSTARSRRRTRKTSKPRDTSQVTDPRDCGDNSRVIENFALTPIIQEDDLKPLGHATEGRTILKVPDPSQGIVSAKKNMVYVQTQKGFKGHSSDWIRARKSEAAKSEAEMTKEMMDECRQTATVELALSICRKLDFFTYYIHSFLFGASLYQILHIASLSTTDLDTFFLNYSGVAVALHIGFKVSLVFCLIAALDRFDIGAHGWLIFIEMCRANGKAWNVLVYFVATMVEFSTVSLSIWLKTNNPTKHPNNSYTSPPINSSYLNDNPEQHYVQYFALTIVKTVMCVLGWFLLSADPEGNYTIENLYINPAKKNESATIQADA